MNHFTFELSPILPFRLDLTVWALRRRPDNLIDRWDGETYRRALTVNGKVVLVEVTQKDTVLRVTAFSDVPVSQLQHSTADSLERILGTQVDLSGFYEFARQDPDLGPLVQQFLGVKPPRFFSLFEALVNSISCQQISLTFCVRLMNRLVQAWGPAVNFSGEPVWAFPEPRYLLDVEPEELRNMGYSYNKARAILEAASLIESGELDLEHISSLSDTEAIDALMQLRGVGHWTAEYTLLRGAGRTNLFPTGDSGALANLKRWLGRGKEITPHYVSSVLASWSPYAGLVYFHLLLRKLNESGYFK